MECQSKEEPVLHIVVVGFHHKKGCQVEFSYPPIIPSAGHDSSTLPEEWKYLPFLALPDGAHNHQEGMIEYGLADSSHYQTRRSISEDFSSPEIISADEESLSLFSTDITRTPKENEHRYDVNDPPDQSKPCNSTLDTHYIDARAEQQNLLDSSESEWETLEPHVMDEKESKMDIGHLEMFDADSGLPITVQPQSATGHGTLSTGLVSGLQEDQYGQPLAIFTKGYLCMPYMALQQHHLLSDINVRGFVSGATNVLFRQQRHLSDAVVDVDEAQILIHDPELRKMLNLSTADLRFADYLVKHVTENKEDVFLDGTGWEGGDEWIRAQFGLYMHSLLSSALQQDHERLLADYGVLFTSAWKMTHNYKMWISNKHPAMAEITPGSMQNSERGKKIGNAVMSTSRSVVQTGKAVGQSVGGALTVAKSAMSSWFSMLAQPTAAVTSSQQSSD